jgi:TPR repeat protein
MAGQEGKPERQYVHGEVLCKRSILPIETFAPRRRDARSFTLSSKACDGEDANGCGTLGNLYWRGFGVPNNLALARQLLIRAATRATSGDATS